MKANGIKYEANAGLIVFNMEERLEKNEMERDK
jgi:hypothetical protein